MEKGADVRLVAATPVTVNAFILVRVVEPLNSGVALVAEETLGAELPPQLLVGALHELTVFGLVVEDFGRPPEVPHVMSVETSFGVVGILSTRTPTALVLEHVEGEGFPLFAHFQQVLVQVGAVE